MAIVDIGRLIARLDLDTGGMDRGVSHAEQQAKRIGMLSHKFYYAGMQLSMAFTAPLTALVGVATYQYLKFDKAMTESTAIMSDVTADLRRQMEDTAHAISNASSFTAAQVAEGYYHLASAGLSAQQALYGIGQAERFAMAGQMDLAQSTELLAGSMNAMGMSSKDTTQYMSNMRRVSDVLTKANNLAAGTTLSFAKALANNTATAFFLTGKSIEEAVAPLMALANRFELGESAGEKLAIIVRDLQRSFLENRSVWNEYGLSIYDTTGKMLPFTEIMGKLEERYMSLSHEGRKVLMMQLGFQERSVMATMSLLGFTEQVRQYENALKSAGGTTEEVANKQMKSLTNQLAAVRHQWQSLFDNLASDYNPELNKMIQNVGDLATWFDGLNWEAQTFIIRTLAILAAMGPAFMVMSGVINVLNAFKTVLSVIGGYMNLATLRTLQFVSASSNIASAIVSWMNLGSVVGRMNGLLAWGKNIWGMAGRTHRAISYTITFSNGTSLMRTILVPLTAMEKYQIRMSRFLNWFDTAMDHMLMNISSSFSAIGTQIAGWATRAVGGVMSVVTAIRSMTLAEMICAAVGWLAAAPWSAIIGIMAGVAAAIALVVTLFWDGGISLDNMGARLAAFGQNVLGFFTNFGENMSLLWVWFKANWSTLFVDLLRFAGFFLITFVGNFLNAFVLITRLEIVFAGWLVDQFKKLFTLDFWKAVWDGLVKVWSTLVDWVAKLMVKISDIIWGRQNDTNAEGKGGPMADFMREGSLMDRFGQVWNDQSKNFEGLSGFQWNVAAGPKLNLATKQPEGNQPTQGVVPAGMNVPNPDDRTPQTLDNTKEHKLGGGAATFNSMEAYKSIVGNLGKESLDKRMQQSVETQKHMASTLDKTYEVLAMGRSKPTSIPK